MGPDYILESAASRRRVFSVRKTVFPGRVNERRRGVHRAADREASVVDWQDLSPVMSSYTRQTTTGQQQTATSGVC